MTVPQSRSLTEDGVSAKTAAALRAAMHRLFDGRAQHTDGRLTNENFWATAILTEWEARNAVYGVRTPSEAQRDEEITSLQRKLAKKTRECTLLSKRLDAAAIAIAALHHDNKALRQELSARGDVSLRLIRSGKHVDGQQAEGHSDQHHN